MRTIKFLQPTAITEGKFYFNDCMLYTDETGQYITVRVKKQDEEKLLEDAKEFLESNNYTIVCNEVDENSYMKIFVVTNDTKSGEAIIKLARRRKGEDND